MTRSLARRCGNPERGSLWWEALSWTTGPVDARGRQLLPGRRPSLRAARERTQRPVPRDLRRLPAFEETGLSQPAALLLRGTAPDPGLLVGDDCELKAAESRLAWSTDRLRLLDLLDSRAGGADREEDVRADVTTGRSLAPLVAVPLDWAAPRQRHLASLPGPEPPCDTGPGRHGRGRASRSSQARSSVWPAQGPAIDRQSGEAVGGRSPWLSPEPAGVVRPN